MHLSISASVQVHQFAYTHTSVFLKKYFPSHKALKFSHPKENIFLSSWSELWLLTLLLPWETFGTVIASSGFQFGLRTEGFRAAFGNLGCHFDLILR